MKSAFGVSVPEGLSEICSSNRCALIIYDMQAGIVPQLTEGPQVVARVREALSCCPQGRYAGFLYPSICSSRIGLPAWVSYGER